MKICVTMSMLNAVGVNPAMVDLASPGFVTKKVTLVAYNAHNPAVSSQAIVEDDLTGEWSPSDTKAMQSGRKLRLKDKNGVIIFEVELSAMTFAIPGALYIPNPSVNTDNQYTYISAICDDGN